MKLGLPHRRPAGPDARGRSPTGRPAEGFELLEIACWPRGGGERRRYAGVSHIDVDDLDRPARAIRAMLDRHGLDISSLAYYPNPLHPDDGTARPRQRAPAAR